MDDFYTGAGATFSLSADAPATYNQAGYEACDFTEAGWLTNMGDRPSKQWTLVTLTLLKAAGQKKAKGSYNLGNQTITLAINPDDAGQLLIDAATDSRDTYSIKLDHPGLGTVYARALVMGGPITWGDQDTPATRQVTIEYTIVDDDEDGIVVVPVA